MEGNGTCLGLSNVQLMYLIRSSIRVKITVTLTISTTWTCISYSNNRQAVPVETGTETSVDNDQIPNVVATRKSCRVKRIPRRLIE